MQKTFIADVAIGLYYNGQSAISQEIISYLKQFDSINIIEFNDLQSMKDALAFSKIESGYVFSEDIDTQIENGAINRAVKLYKTGKTMSDGFTNELMFAALQKAAAPYIASNYLFLNGESESKKSLYDDVSTKISKYYNYDNFMELNITYTGSKAAQTKNNVTTGLISIYIYTMFMYTAVNMAKEKEKGFYLKLSAKSKALYMSAYVLSNGLLTFAAVCPFSPFIGSSGIFNSLVATAAYIAVLCVTCALFGAFAKYDETYYGIIPILSVSAVVLGGVFFNIGAVFPAVKPVQYLFPTYYFTVFLQVF